MLNWSQSKQYGSLMLVLSRFSRVHLYATLWIVAHQASLSMGFSRQEYWSGLPFPSPGNLPNPGIEPASLITPCWKAGSLLLAPPGNLDEGNIRVTKKDSFGE